VEHFGYNGKGLAGLPSQDLDASDIRMKQERTARSRCVTLVCQQLERIDLDWLGLMIIGGNLLGTPPGPHGQKIQCIKMARLVQRR